MIVGKPVLTPQWALGWHQSRWGYTSLAEVKKVESKFRSFGLPLEVIWTDIDYMNDYRTFSYDPLNFGGLS